MILRGIALVVLASSLSACSTVGSMWSRLKDRDEAGTAAIAAAPAAPEKSCEALGVTAAVDPANRAATAEEMKRLNCPNIPAT
jgi:hypothetical protein